MKKKELKKRIKELEQQVKKLEEENNYYRHSTIVIPPWVGPKPKEDDYIWRDDLDGTCVPRPIPQWRITC